MDELKLYYLPTCPFCLKVLRFMEGKNLPVALLSTNEPANHDYLVSHGGKGQVPCLFIGEQALYESSDIIAYLKERFC